jgi:hypothetical protein
MLRGSKAQFRKNGKILFAKKPIFTLSNVCSKIISRFLPFPATEGYNSFAMKNGRQKRRYPWAHWFASGKFRLIRGQHYSCRTASMVQAIYQASRPNRFNADVSVLTAEDGQSLTVEVRGYRK